MHIHSLFLQYLIVTRPIGYALIFLGMVFEGDVMLFTAFFLTHQGFFDFGDMAFTVLAGVFLGDMTWYWLGNIQIIGKFPNIYSWVERLTKPFDQHTRERPFYTIFISKFTYGIHHLILMRFAMLNIPFKEFLRSDIPAVIGWILIVGSIGYFSSASLFLIQQYLRFAEISLLFGLLIFFAVWHWIGRISKEKL